MKSKTKSGCSRIIHIISTALLAISVVVCLLVSIQVSTQGYVSCFGYSIFRVVTGSMEPTLPVGTVILCRSERVENIQAGDIVCFRSREAGILGKVVTHRVLNVLTAEDGTLLLETKGDANVSSDGYFVQQDNLIGCVIWYSGEGSWLKNVMSFMTGKIGFWSCIAIPILLLSSILLRDSVKNMQKEIKEAMDALAREEPSSENDGTDSYVLTQEEYQEIYERIRAELIEEFKQNEADQISNPEQASGE